MGFVFVSGVDAIHADQAVFVAAVEGDGVVVEEAALREAVLGELCVELDGLLDLGVAGLQGLQEELHRRIEVQRFGGGGRTLVAAGRPWGRRASAAVFVLRFYHFISPY